MCAGFVSPNIGPSGWEAVVIAGTFGFTKYVRLLKKLIYCQLLHVLPLTL